MEIVYTVLEDMDSNEHKRQVYIFGKICVNIPMKESKGQRRKQDGYYSNLTRRTSN